MPSTLAPKRCAIHREADADAQEHHLGRIGGDLGLLGERHGVGRIAEGHEGVGAGARRLADQRREILRADGIALVVGELEARIGEALAGGLREVDAEAVGDRDHGDVGADLALVAQLLQQSDQRVDILRAGAEQPEAVGPALDEIGRAIGDGAEGELRIAVLVEHRPDREIEAGAPRREQQVDLVLGHQPLDGTHGLLGVGAVVVFDDFDRHALAADHQPALGVHVLDPHLVVRDLGDGGAAGIGAGLGNGVADLDLVLRHGRRRGERRRGQGRKRAQSRVASWRVPSCWRFPDSFFFANESLL